MFMTSFPMIVLAVIGALFLIGLALMPTETLFPLTGVVLILIGLGLLLRANFTAGPILVAIGIAMIIFGIRLRARKAREDERASDETATRMNRVMNSLYIPKDDET